MNENLNDPSGWWKHVHGEADEAESAALKAQTASDERWRREVAVRTRLDARIRRLMKASEQSPAALEDRIAVLWERTRAAEEEPEQAAGQILWFRWPSLVALAAGLMLVAGSMALRPEGLVWMTPGLDPGGERGTAGAAEAFYSAEEVGVFVQSLQQAISAIYSEREGPSGWMAKWRGQQRYLRPSIRSFPDGRLLVTLESFTRPGTSAEGVWSESFSNADDFRLNAGDWAGRVAEEIVEDSNRRN